MDIHRGVICLRSESDMIEAVTPQLVSASLKRKMSREGYGK